MSKFDQMINDKLQASQFAVGASAVFFSIISKNLALNLPKGALRIFDFTFVRVLILAFLITTQTKKPTLSLITAAVMVLSLQMLGRKFAPEAPPLSDILKPEEEKKKDGEKSPLVCNCAPTIVVPEKRQWF
jgi:hypothetical protein